MKSQKIALLVSVIILIQLSACPQLKEYRRIVSDIQIENIDLQRVKDGDYTGKFDAIMVEAEVLVKVRDHRITTIDLVRHHNGRGEAAEVIPGWVVEKQSLQVDAVSGATSSSKVILEAIELALKQGLE